MPKPIDMDDATMDSILSMHLDKNCYYCRHYRSDYTCAAFPDRIPIQFLTTQEVHDKPYPGDDGIRFEPIEETK